MSDSEGLLLRVTLGSVLVLEDVCAGDMLVNEEGLVVARAMEDAPAGWVPAISDTTAYAPGTPLAPYATY